MGLGDYMDGDLDDGVRWKLRLVWYLGQIGAGHGQQEKWRPG